VKQEIIFTQKPSGLCPVQAEGTINGHPFYFRSRHENWAVRVADAKDGDPISGPNWIHEEDYPGNEYSAGYASEKECIEFINKCAQLWADRKQA